MTIRTKLTLWYVGVLFISLLLCSLMLYREWVLEPRRERRRKHEEHLKEKVREERGGNRKQHDEYFDSDEIAEGLADNAFWVAIPAAILGLGGGWWLMRKAMAPVAMLSKAAGQINESNLGVRLPRSGSGDELDRLTAMFNDMAARLDESFRRIREFTLRASHELKTPLTIMRGSMETALSGAQFTPEQKEWLSDEIDEVDRLAKIVDGLTLLTKADAGLVVLKRETVRIDQLLHEIHADGQVLARPVGVGIRLGECEEITISGDNNRLRQMLLNLVDNAVKYNVRGGSVALSLKRLGTEAVITISNTGPGISPGLLPRLFDPFFRGDVAHGREIDGCGLGLAIVRWIATAHKGTVKMTSLPGEITTVEVTLPSGKDTGHDGPEDNYDNSINKA